MAPIAFLAQPQVRIALDNDIIVVHPKSEGSSLVRGTLLLALPKRKAIKQIKIELVGLCDAYGGTGWPYETHNTLYHELELVLDGEVFEAGDHAFSFSLLIPSDTAPFQRSVHGRIRHYLKGTVAFASHLRTSVSSPPVIVFIFASLLAVGESPEAFDLEMEHYCEHLGPLLVSLWSPNLTVGALIFARLSFVSPPEHLTIESVNGFVGQGFEVHYPERGTVARPSLQRIVLVKTAASNSASSDTFNRTDSLSTNELDEQNSSVPERGYEEPTPLHALEYGQPWTAHWVFRVPDIEEIRPSTFDNSDTRIRVHHKFMIEIKFVVRDGEGKEERKKLTLATPIMIDSCPCMSTSLSSLPPYSVKQANGVKRTTRQCACSLAGMFDGEGQAFEHVLLHDSLPSVDAQLDDAGEMFQFEARDRMLKSPSLFTY